MDPSLRHRLFVASMVAIERHDARLVESLQNLLGRPPPDQPYFLDVNVSGLVREAPPGDDSARVPQSDPCSSSCSDVRPPMTRSKNCSPRTIHKSCERPSYCWAPTDK
jgi:hypothetical protein